MLVDSFMGTIYITRIRSCAYTEPERFRWLLFGDEVLGYRLAKHGRRQQPLRQDEVVEAPDIEFRTQSLLGGLADLEQPGVSIEVRHGLPGGSERVALHFFGG